MSESLFIVTGASRGMGEAIAQQLLAPRHVVLGISAAANRVIAYLARPDFGTNPVADVRDA